MRDLYKQLCVPETAAAGDVRAAVAAADPATREAAEYILLDPDRREVYDRNRRVVSTIGRLRANLGLNLTRFWSRARFADFTHDLATQAGGAPAGQHAATDPMSMAWAFGVKPPPSPAARLRRKRLAAAGVALLILAALFIAWRLTHG